MKWKTYELISYVIKTLPRSTHTQPHRSAVSSIVFKGERVYHPLYEDTAVLSYILGCGAIVVLYERINNLKI
jgi:hypothetical protein